MDHRPWADRLEQVRTIADTQRGAITGQQLRLFLHPRQIQRIVADGHLTPLWRGAYALEAGHPPGVWTRLSAAELTLGRPVVACLDTAGEIHGPLAPPSAETHVMAPGTTVSERSGLSIHRHRPLAPPVRVNGVLVEDPAECAVRVAAAQRGRPAVLSILDAALHNGAVAGVDALRDMASQLAGRGVRDLVRMAPLAHPGARSAADSWIRWLCWDRAFDVPEIVGSRDDLAGGMVGEAPSLAGADYRWSRYRVAASLTRTDDPRLGGMHVLHSVAPGTEWAHVLLESLPEADCPPGIRPIHPVGQSRLLMALSSGRRQWVWPPRPARIGN